MSKLDKKILVIDDSLPIRRMLELKFKNHGYHVETAANGKEGFRKIKTHRPHAVITDINMPEMDGKTLCELTDPIKKQHPFLTIVVTCRIAPDDLHWIKTMRDTLFMPKPFSPTKILEAVNQYFDAQGDG